MKLFVGYWKNRPWIVKLPFWTYVNCPFCLEEINGSKFEAITEEQSNAWILKMIKLHREEDECLTQ